ncbi:hypothetical protein ACOMICROBIO_GDFFDHBD_04169 (plasmid) [Vibrio sp. B1REV9]|nr:hypothetical protein ACOMICROBIO_GDFFDHBD_04169 [Vibrio sp. B1REV9]
MRNINFIGIILAFTSISAVAGEVNCTLTNNANVHFEQCYTIDKIYSWTKTSIEVGDKIYLDGQDRHGISWSGVRENFGDGSKTVYRNQQGRVLTTRNCQEPDCLAKLVSYCSNEGILSINN